MVRRTRGTGLASGAPIMKIEKCTLGVVLLAGLVLGRGQIAGAQDSLDEPPPAESDAIAAETEPDAGGIRVVERSGDHETSLALQSVGAGLAVLGVATLAIEGVWIAAAFCLFEPDCASRPDLPPVELTWAALGAIGGGLVIALVGLLVEVATPRGPDVTRIAARPWLHIDHTGGAGGVSIDL